MRCYAKCHGDSERVFSIAFPAARDPTPIELSQGKGEKEVNPKGRRLDRLATNTSPSRPAVTPDLTSVIARGQAILKRLPKLSIPIQIARNQEPRKPKSLGRPFRHGILHNVSHVCDVAPSPTRARGHVAERRAAEPQSPRRPKGAPMYLRAVMRSCTRDWCYSFFNSIVLQYRFSRC
jgi:hypothetical protein